MKRGQAAFEFMFTYGWAFILILSVVGILTYFQTSPSKSLPERCTFSTEVTCNAWQITNAGGVGTLNLRLTNSIGDNVTLLDDSITILRNGGGDLGCDPLLAGGAQMQWGAGETQTFTLSNCGNMGGYQVGQKEKVKVIIRYHKDPSFPHEVYGDIFTLVR